MIVSLDPRSDVRRVFPDETACGMVHTFSTVGPSRLGYSPAAEREIKSRSYSTFDVLHQHGIWMAFSRVSNRWREMFQRPTVVAPQGSLTPQALQYSRIKKALAYLAYERNNLRQATCLQATAEGELESFRRLGLRNPVAVIPNGVPNDWIETTGSATRFRTQFSLPSDSRFILSLSRIHPKKGLLLLIRAFAMVQASLPDWRLVIAGPAEDVGYADQLERLAAELRISRRVHFTGPVYGQAKYDAFAAADLFVLPTLSDNFAITVAEALGAGVPVVTTDKAVAWPMLGPLKCGWQVSPEPGCMAEALQAAYAVGSAGRTEMGSRGRNLVREKFLWSHVADQTIELYRWLRGGASRPAFVAI